MNEAYTVKRRNAIAIAKDEYEWFFVLEYLKLFIIHIFFICSIVDNGGIYRELPNEKTTAKNVNYFLFLFPIVHISFILRYCLLFFFLSIIAIKMGNELHETVTLCFSASVRSQQRNDTFQLEFIFYLNGGT